ncbi:related to pisatin demethylase cytochrome P450 [Rhynchosporium agropyri]|uniref:Related to pisatin demethylase cytochrome P450 n=1 Tax=Rhynchosporium agropyri TaxID=914238 RepID=A0A1E1K3J2_9HELO|nr:related to pisatin demethylase cytochrome P450 [Rhynchosporium agropyri]
MVSPMGGAILLAAGIIMLANYIIRPLHLAPLSKIPAAHPISPISSLWICYVRWTGREHVTLCRLHQIRGPILRIGPNEVSINYYEGFQTIYNGRFDKAEVYVNRFSNYGIRNMISTIHQQEHAIRRRMFSNLFTLSQIWTSPSLRSAISSIIYKRLLPTICMAADSAAEIDIHPLACAYSIDLLQSYQFGTLVSSNFINNRGKRGNYLEKYFAKAPYQFCISELHLLVSFSSWLGIGIVPSHIKQAQKDLEDSMLKKCFDAEKLVLEGEDLAPEHVPVVFKQIYNAFRESENDDLEGQKINEYTDQHTRHIPEIASDMLDFNAAALEATGDAFIWLYLQLSLHPNIQEEFRKVLHTLSTIICFPTKMPHVLPDPRDLDDLPLLNAIVLETLRLYPASDGGQRGIIPSPPCNLAGHNLPPGVVVQASAYVRHHNSNVFPTPNEWIPKRWFNATPEMKRWLWAFGSGSKMCIGSNFAMYSMKYAIAAIYTNFTSECTNPEVRNPMDTVEGSTIGARHKLPIKFKPS